MKIKFLLAIFCISFQFSDAQYTGIDYNTKWNFIKGDTIVPQISPIYGEQGKVADGNMPGARQGACTWKDNSGNLWLFGGKNQFQATPKYYNDLWKYIPATNQWIFIKGDIALFYTGNIGSNIAGVYGSKGVASEANKPGARSAAVTWVDNSGNLWLFGGTGQGSILGEYPPIMWGTLNDLWKFDPSNNQWTWVNGDNDMNVPIVYGSMGIPDQNNKPNGSGKSWSDTAGNFWFYNGNTIWKYTHEINQWAWVNGDSINNLVVYGSMGIPSATNNPGSTFGKSSWNDNSGNLWCIGGANCLWKYQTDINQWAWIKGDTSNSNGSYNTMGVEAPENKPPDRPNATCWSDISGNLWMWGGLGVAFQTRYNDLWKFNMTSNQWTWVKGDSIPEPANVLGTAIYGTLGIPGEFNKPGGKTACPSWTDGLGNLWLFGGNEKRGGDNTMTSDLWKYNIPINQWAWVKGSKWTSAPSIVYGENGLVAEGNNPGAREGSISWVDAAGNTWLFGGDADTTTGVDGFKNDLWKYNTTADQWIWMKGDISNDNTGVYGTPGVADAGNKPGARIKSVTWTDASGNLWLFGGLGYHASSSGYLNDLWKYDVSTNNWTWIKGDNTGGVAGVYGTPGVADASNKPGARSGAVSWTDGSGKLWLFGGYGYHANGIGLLNDLWKYDPLTNEWTWIKGANVGDVLGIYGTLGSSASSNNPGSREYSVSWIDNTGNLWLFAGNGFHESSNGILNDLWKYDPLTNEWAWMNGNKTGNAPGIYGIQGTETSVNMPGARFNHVSWKDNSGNLWFFGGFGYAQSFGGNLNDLWKYNIASNQWVWIKGDSDVNKTGIYGNKLTGSLINTPGASKSSVSGKDLSGNFWLFGGYGNTSNGGSLLNLLMKYDPSGNQWTWIKGSTSNSCQGIFGQQGISAYKNKPGSRSGSVSWTDTLQNLWLFGGKDNTDFLNDLWKFDHAKNQWTWIKGDTTKNMFSAVYGTINFPGPNNKPGARHESISWIDSTGKLWLFGGSYIQGGITKTLNDLWKFDPITNQWTWINGDNTINNSGTYGTMGVPEISNKPGAREGSISWIDSQGYLWLFGGTGYANNTNYGHLNDLWKYDPSTNFWTWVKGDYVIDVAGNYGSLGNAATTNNPGARNGSVSWIDDAGKFWLFGGSGFDQSGLLGKLNDLWKYDPATNFWTWVNGNETRNKLGAYNSAAGYYPGARDGSISWIDIFGKLWFFGGSGYDENSSGDLNDLWKYDPTNNQWTWVKGSKSINAYSSPYQPGARNNGISWTDLYGNLWLFGGKGNGSSGNGYLNDLWNIFSGTTFIFIGNGEWSEQSNWFYNLKPPTTITKGMNVAIRHKIPGVCINNGSLILESNSKLIVESGKFLTINQGDLLNDGSIEGFGNLKFTGVDISYLRSSGRITTPIILESKEMELSGNSITDIIKLKDTSHLKLNGYNLNIGSANLDGDNENFIITNNTGRLIRHVASNPVNFHIGITSSSYTPVSIANSGTPDDFLVRVSPGVSSTVPITTGNVDRTWFIKDSVQGGSNATLNMQWNGIDEQADFMRVNSYISHYFDCSALPNCTNSYYDFTTSASASGIGPYNIERSGITNFATNSFIVSSSPFVYTFTGNGDWIDPNNWTPGVVPPSVIGKGMEVIINPIDTGECIHNGDIIIQQLGKLTVLPGKIMRVRH